MDSSRVDYREFRRKLDDVLRQRDPAALRVFLIEQGQWKESDQTDTEAAMWMMIATSPALGEMHAEAERWLLGHGHEVEARAIFGGGMGGAPRGSASPRGAAVRGMPPRPVGPARDRRNGHHPPKPR